MAHVCPTTNRKEKISQIAVVSTFDAVKIERMEQRRGVARRLTKIMTNPIQHEDNKT